MQTYLKFSNHKNGVLSEKGAEETKVLTWHPAEKILQNFLISVKEMLRSFTNYIM